MAGPWKYMNITHSETRVCVVCAYIGPQRLHAHADGFSLESHCKSAIILDVHIPHQSLLFVFCLHCFGNVQMYFNVISNLAG